MVSFADLWLSSLFVLGRVSDWFYVNEIDLSIACCSTSSEKLISNSLSAFFPS